MKIVGNTVGTSLPKPDLRQKDPKKGNFVHGKDEIEKAVYYSLAQAKESGLFDGKDGQDGKDGKDGSPGKDGVDGQPGKDGVSVTHSWNGTVLSVTSASGTSSADLKGEPGKDGNPGADGKTPIKGTDYFTPDEVQAVAKQAAEMVEVPGGGGGSGGGVARWVKRAEATVTEENTQRIKFTEDLDGNPLNIDKAHRWIVESSNINYSANSYVDLKLNKNWNGGTTNSVACRAIVYTGADHLIFTAEPFPTGQFMIMGICANPGTQNMRTNNVMMTTPNSYDGQNINTISVVCKSGTYFAVGTTIAVYEEVFE